MTVAVLAAALPLGACSLGDKQARADAIVDSVRAVDDAGRATGSIRLQIAVLSTPSGETFPESGPITTNYGVTLDLDRRVAALSGESGPPSAVFFDDVFYGKRKDALPADARPWMQLEVADVDEEETHVDLRDTSLSALLHALSPLLVLDMAAGPLAGSATAPSVDIVDGEPMQRYLVNMDVDKALSDTRRRHYDEERRDEVDVLLGLVDVRGTIHSGEVWIDDAGRLRRFVWHLKLEPVRDLLIDAKVDLRLDSFGAPVELAAPSDEEVLGADGLVAFLASVTGGAASDGVPGQLEVIDAGEAEG